MPTRVKLFGDKQKAYSYRMFALRKVLPDAIFLRGNLSQYRHVVPVASDGSYIEIVSNYNLHEISIYSPPVTLPERDIPQRPMTVIVVAVGDDEVGYHFFLWSIESKVKVSSILYTDSLKKLWNLYRPIKQDDIYWIHDHPVKDPEAQMFSEAHGDGSILNDFIAGDNRVYYNCSPPEYECPDHDNYTDQIDKECIDKAEYSVNHPKDGSFVDERQYSKYYTKCYSFPENYLNEWGMCLESEQLMMVLDGYLKVHYAHHHDSLMGSNELRYIPKQESNVNANFVNENAYFRSSIEGKYLDRWLAGVNWSNDDPTVQQDVIHYWSYKVIDYNIPLNGLKRTRGTIFKTKDIEASENQLIYGRLLNKDNGNMFNPDPLQQSVDDPDHPEWYPPEAGRIEHAPYSVWTLQMEFDSDTNWYESQGDSKQAEGRAIAEKDKEFLRFLEHKSTGNNSEVDYFFQVYGFTFSRDYFLHICDPDLPNIPEYNYDDVIYIAARADKIKNWNDNTSDDEFSEAISDLIIHASKKQRESGYIDRTRVVKGQLCTYFANSLNQEKFSWYYMEKLKFINLINDLRKSKGLHILRYNFMLEKAAIRMGVDLLLNKPFGGGLEPHVESDGSNLRDRVQPTGYLDNHVWFTPREDEKYDLEYYDYPDDPYYDDGRFRTEYGMLGENLYYSYNINAGAKEAFENWMDSPDHYHMMIHPDITEIALDVRTGVDDFDYPWIGWVLNVGYNRYNDLDKAP